MYESGEKKKLSLHAYFQTLSMHHSSINEYADLFAGSEERLNFPL